MILQVAANRLQVKQGRDAVALQLITIANAREHQQLRRIDSAARQYDFASCPCSA